MDLNTIETIARPASRAELPRWTDGTAFLGGGTWLFSEPQPALRRLVDLHALGWPALEASAAGLRVAATCTIAGLHGFVAPADWAAWAVIDPCCHALLGSFKVWNAATVGGNVCLALPAAPMLALTVALDGVAVIWRPDGTERRVPMAAFATGTQRTVLTPGEVLRAIDLPVSALRRRAAVRQASLTTHGRSAALLVATRDGGGACSLTVTASTAHPLRWDWPAPPRVLDLDIPDALWVDDVHGSPAWRRHMTLRLAAELRAELFG